MFGNKFIVVYNGLMDIHGRPRYPTWTLLVLLFKYVSLYYPYLIVRNRWNKSNINNPRLADRLVNRWVNSYRIHRLWIWKRWSQEHHIRITRWANHLLCLRVEIQTLLCKRDLWNLSLSNVCWGRAPHQKRCYQRRQLNLKNSIWCTHHVIWKWINWSHWPYLLHWVLRRWLGYDHI